jgi:hypothetical protein
VSDALTIVKAWALAGRPESDIPLSPVSTIGLATAGIRSSGLAQPDPVTTLFAQMSDDPDAELLGRLMSEWSESIRERRRRACVTW